MTALADVGAPGARRIVGRLALEDGLVRDTKSNRDGLYGMGLYVNAGGQADVQRSLFERNRYSSVLSDGAGDCPWTDAHALDIRGGAPVVARRATLQNAPTCGLLLGPREGGGAGAIELEHALILGNGIGVCVQSAGVDLSTLTGTTVRYQDNQSRFETTVFPIPGPVLPADPGL